MVSYSIPLSAYTHNLWVVWVTALIISSAISFIIGVAWRESLDQRLPSIRKKSRRHRARHLKVIRGKRHA